MSAVPSARIIAAQAAELREIAQEFLTLAADRPPEGPDAYAVAYVRGAGTAVHVGPFRVSVKTMPVTPALDFTSVLLKIEAESIAAKLGDDFEVVLYDDLARLNAEHLFRVAGNLEQLAEKSEREVEAYRS